MFRIPLSYTPINVARLSHVLSQYTHRHHLDMVRDFEQQLADLTGAKYVVALNSGTAAIHLALKALNVEPDDLVIAPTFTYVASVNPVLYQKAVPLLVDSERETWNIDPALVEKAIIESPKKPKAIIVVHNYGFPAKLDELTRISEQYSIPILEDAAEAIGSRYQNRHLGTIGEVGVLSFNNNKIMTTYGGGAILTDNPQIFEKVSFWATQSREDKPYYEHIEVGYNYRMSPLNAAAGLALLPGLMQEVERRRNDFQFYRTELESRGAIFLPEPQGYLSNRWLTTLTLPGSCTAENLRITLSNNGIETRFLWNPMHRQALFKGNFILNSGISDQLFDCGICLPSGLASVDDREEVVERIKQIF